MKRPKWLRVPSWYSAVVLPIFTAYALVDNWYEHGWTGTIAIIVVAVLLFGVGYVWVNWSVKRERSRNHIDQ